MESSATFRPSNSRSTSMTLFDSPRSASPVSTLDENCHSLPRLLKTSLERLPRSTSFSADSTRKPVLSKTASNASASSIEKIRARRANSTGNTTLHSMSGSMRKRYGLAFEGQALPESEEERQVKCSVELLRLKELTLPGRPSSELPATERAMRPTVAAIPLPTVTRPSNDGQPSPPPSSISPPPLSPSLPDPERPRTAKAQSTFNPITTAGLWDSGVTERPGLKSRPTSMFVMNERKKREERRRERSKSKEAKKSEKERFIDDKGSMCSKRQNDWRRLKNSMKSLFRRDRA